MQKFTGRKQTSRAGAGAGRKRSNSAWTKANKLAAAWLPGSGSSSMACRGSAANGPSGPVHQIAAPDVCGGIGNGYPYRDILSKEIGGLCLCLD